MAVKLSDLPPKYQQQVLQQLVERKREKNQGKTVSVAGMPEFDSRGEQEFYLGVIVPKMQRGEVVRFEAHPRFDLFPAGEFCGIKLSAVRYTADFRLDYRDGSVEIVEVKSKFVRRMQRDYALRRRVFLESVARPRGWRFVEVITTDSKEDLDNWKKRKKQEENHG